MDSSIAKHLDTYLVHVTFPISIILAAAIASLIIFAARIRRNVNSLRIELEHRLRADGHSPAVPLDLREFQLFDQETAALQQDLDRARNEISRRNAQWRALFSNMSEGVIVVDDNDRLALINPAAARVFKLPEGNAEPGGSFHEAIRNAELFELIQLAREEEAPVSQDVAVELPSTIFQHFLASAVRFSYGERDSDTTLIVLTDITRLRQLESMREEFVANVSHELKTPLTAVIGYLETIEDCLGEPKNVKRFLATTARHAVRMNAIIDDLLYLSRLEQGDPTIANSSGPVDLRNLAAKCLRSRKKMAAKNNIHLVAEVPQIEIKADVGLLEQALDNLLTNAIKYSPPEATVTIFADQSEDEVAIGVRDTGAGIPKEHLDRIFERFYRVDKSRDRMTGGTGLGLSIVKHVALVHSGRLTVESALGEGAVFSIHLPA